MVSFTFGKYGSATWFQREDPAGLYTAEPTVTLTTMVMITPSITMTTTQGLTFLLVMLTKM